MKSMILRVGAAAALFALLILSLAAVAVADDWSDETVVTVADESGNAVFTLAGSVSEGDEYISRDNILYRIERVTGDTAIARRIGEESMPDVSWLDAGEAQAVFAPEVQTAAAQSDSSKKLIAMYVTHSDESYVPSDGTQSIDGQGGIYDVARSFRDALQVRGVDVILDESTHLPHDSGAYRRSRRTAERLLQRQPDAIIDIHRDGIPDQSEYTCSINGENASQIRLLVGRANQNSQVNREFAKQIKAVADKQYPGLIKDIYMGKGAFNQDLLPRALLLECGTYTLSKERVLVSMPMMADVMYRALYGGVTGSAGASDVRSGSAEKGGVTPGATDAPVSKSSRGTGNGLLWLVVIAVAALVIYGIVSTGSFKGGMHKIGRNINEMSGGLIGKKPDEGDKPPEA